MIAKLLNIFFKNKKLDNHVMCITAYVDNKLKERACYSTILGTKHTTKIVNFLKNKYGKKSKVVVKLITNGRAKETLGVLTTKRGG
jgi:hypothetical protein